AIDNDYAIWRAFDNHYWPAHYFIDAQGRIRHHHFGEGSYDESERVIRALLAEDSKNAETSELTKVSASGAEAAADKENVRSPETYVGYARAENFTSPGGAVKDAAHDYAQRNNGGPNASMVSMFAPTSAHRPRPAPGSVSTAGLWDCTAKQTSRQRQSSQPV